MLFRSYLLYTYGVFLIWAGWRLQSWAETYDWHGILCIFLGLILLINKLYRWMGDTPSHGRRIVCRQNLLDTKWPELRETLAHQVVL